MVPSSDCFLIPSSDWFCVQEYVEHLTARYNAAREHARLEVERKFREQFYDQEKSEYNLQSLKTTIQYNKWQTGKGKKSVPVDKNGVPMDTTG